MRITCDNVDDDGDDEDEVENFADDDVEDDNVAEDEVEEDNVAEKCALRAAAKCLCGRGQSKRTSTGHKNNLYGHLQE